jgi:hypothetical protein
VAEAQTLPFVRRDGSGRATPVEIATDYQAVQKLYVMGGGKAQQMPAAAQQKYTKLDLTASEVIKLMKGKMKRLSMGLPGAFAPDWMWFPCEARMAIMSMVYGFGQAGVTGDEKLHIKGFPDLMHAVRRFDWQTAARNCKSPGVRPERTNWTRMLFSQAYGMQLMFGDMAEMLRGDFTPHRFGRYGPVPTRSGPISYRPPRQYFSVIQGLQYKR